MWILIRWIKHNSYPLFALILFGFSINQVLRYHIYQHSFYFKSSTAFFRTIDQWKSNVTEFVNLKQENIDLRNENIALRNQLKINSYQFNKYRDTQYFDSLNSKYPNLKTAYSYITTKVIRNSTNSPDNFFYINHGKLQGITPGMAVISPSGVVGVILDCTDNFSRGMSLLNSKFEITPYIPELDLRQGVLKWDGKHSNRGELLEVNRTEPVKKGMKILTSNYSSIFPPNIPIGTIEYINPESKSHYHEIRVKLATDFSRLNNVYCIKYHFKNELDSLNMSSTINPNNND